MLIEAGEDRRETYGWQQSDEDVLAAEQRVFDSIEATGRRFHIAARRIFLAGFDCGGTMAFRVAMKHPERFAGVLSLGGAFPTGGMPLAQAAGGPATFCVSCRRSAQRNLR